MINKKILFSSSDQGGCYLYRAKHISDFLNQDCMIMFPFAKIGEGQLTIRDPRILNSDIIVLQRHVDPVFINVIPDMQSLGKKVIYELDDNLWEIPATNNAHHSYGNKMLKNISQIVKLCDYVTVSTEPLAEYIRARFNPNVIVIPNMLPNMFGYIKKPTDKIRIGFVGSDTHKGDFSFELCQALRRIKSEFNNVELVFMGYNPIPGADVEFHKFVPLDEYFSKLFRLNLHIGICPLRDDTFNRSKSNIKFLEYSACSMATIASDVYPFSETIEEDRTGLLVRKEKEWYGKLKELIICEGVRKSISENAYNYVKSHFTYKQNGIKITNAYNKMLEDMYGSN